MKAEHRHELKTNELAQWVANFPEWFQKNQKTILYSSIAIILVVGYGLWFNYQKNTLKLRQYTRFTELAGHLPQIKEEILRSYATGKDVTLSLLNLSNLARELETIGRSSTNDQMAAMAFIEQGKILRTELHYRPKSPDKSQMTSQINRAKEAFNSALARLNLKDPNNAPIPNHSLTAEAKFEIGMCDEELGNFEDAKKIYQQIMHADKLKNTTAAAQARQRLHIMDSLEAPVAFKPDKQTIPQTMIIPPEMIETSASVIQEPMGPLRVPDSNAGPASTSLKTADQVPGTVFGTVADENYPLTNRDQ